jgi:hypothetical protein
MADALYFGLKRVLTPLADVYFSLRATGYETLPAGPFIVAGNHSSLLDWVFVARFVERPIRFVLTREFYDQAGLTALYRRLGVIPIRGTQVPWSLAFFLVLAVVFGVVLHATPLGRSIYAIARGGRTRRDRDRRARAFQSCRSASVARSRRSRARPASPARTRCAWRTGPRSRSRRT